MPNELLLKIQFRIQNDNVNVKKDSFEYVLRVKREIYVLNDFLIQLTELKHQSEAKQEIEKTLRPVDNCAKILASPTSRGLSTGSINSVDKPRDVGSGMNCQQTLKLINNKRNQLNHLIDQKYTLPKDLKLLKKYQRNDCNFQLIDSIRDNDFDLFNAALNAGADVNYVHLDKTPLLYATEHNNLMMVERLIQLKANVNKVQGFRHTNEFATPLSNATKNKNPEMIKSLLIAVLNNTIEDQENKLNFDNSIFAYKKRSKARRIHLAVERAMKNSSKYESLEEYLNYKEQGKESIMDALSYHRIGFFGQTKSEKRVHECLQELNGLLKS